jgi:hypothetical protein
MKDTRTLAGDMQKINAALLRTLERVPVVAWVIIAAPVFVALVLINSQR